MILSGLRAQVKDYGYADISDGEINAALNVAYLEILGAASWPFLEAGPSNLSIDPSTKKGALTSITGNTTSNVRVVGVSYDDKELGAMSADDYFAGPHALVQAGSVATYPPTHYTIYGGSIFVTPCVSSSFNISVRYLKQAADLDDSSNTTPVFPSRYHQLVVYGAVATLAGEDDDDGIQTRFRELLKTGLEQMRSDLLVKSEGRAKPYGLTGSINYWTDRVQSAGFPKITKEETAILLGDTISDICSRYAWPFLRVETVVYTVAGAKELILPADCVRPLGLYIPEQSRQVNFSSLADHRYDFHPSSSDTPGIPERYSLMPAAPGSTTFPQRVNRLVLWPAPDRVYGLNLLYERTLVPSISTTAAIEWPGPSFVLELGLCYRAALRSSEKEAQARIGVFKTEYEQSIERMRNDFLIEQRDRDPVVRITQSDLWDI